MSDDKENDPDFVVFDRNKSHNTAYYKKIPGVFTSVTDEMKSMSGKSDLKPGASYKTRSTISEQSPTRYLAPSDRGDNIEDTEELRKLRSEVLSKYDWFSGESPVRSNLGSQQEQVVLNESAVNPEQEWQQNISDEYIEVDDIQKKQKKRKRKTYLDRKRKQGNLSKNSEREIKSEIKRNEKIMQRKPNSRRRPNLPRNDNR